MANILSDERRNDFEKATNRKKYFQAMNCSFNVEPFQMSGNISVTKANSQVNSMGRSSRFLFVGFKHDFRL